MLPNYPESYVQEEGVPTENFKKEVQKYLKENSGLQTAFREEHVEAEGDSGKLHNINNDIYIIL